MLAAITTGNDWFVVKPALEKSAHWQLSMLTVMSALALASVGYAVVLSRRTGRSYPIFVCIGAAVACFYEPLGDLLAHVTYHEVGQINLSTAFGYRIPLWVMPSYVIFFGLPSLTIGKLIDDGISLRRWMMLFLIAVASAWISEVPILALGATKYYGLNQPLKILGYPVWVAFANTCTMFIVTTAVHYLKNTVVARRWPALFIVIVPMFVIAGNAAPGLPLSSAINASRDAGLVNVMALASMALATLYVWICGCLVAAPVTAAASLRRLSAGEAPQAASP